MKKKTYNPGKAQSRTEAIRRIARRVYSIERKLREAKQLCLQYPELRRHTSQLVGMGHQANSIGVMIDEAGDAASKKPRA